MPPFLGTLLRRGGGGDIKDNFNRSVSSGLGATSQGGLVWNILTGTWSDNGANPTTATSQSSNPLAVLPPISANAEAWLTLGTGDALYFRVQDASNWWRMLLEGWQTSSCQSCCSTCCSTCTTYCSGQARQCLIDPKCATCNAGGCGCTCNHASGDSCGYSGGCQYACGTSSCNCTSCNCTSCNCTYYNNYRVRLQKMLAGTLSDIRIGATVSSLATTRAHVVLEGSQIVADYDGTSLYSGAQADLATAMLHGIGRGASSYNTSAIDDFEIKWS